MPPWVHRLSDVDPEAKAATCAVCGPVRIKAKGKGHWACLIAVRALEQTPKARASKLERTRRYNARHQAERRERQKPHRKFVKGSCEDCGFVPEHPAQLDVHHVDCNRKNNSPGNLRTLCANCHRLIHVRLREQNEKGPATT